MREVILKVLESWADLQPNMASNCARELLANDLEKALQVYVDDLVETVICGTDPDRE